MTTALTTPNLDGSFPGSASSNLHIPADSSSSRRLSDSVVCRGHDKSTTENERELLKLRKWAAEAMNSRPDSIAEPSLEALEDKNKSAAMHRRDSEGIDCKLRFSGDERRYNNTLPRRTTVYNRSASPDSSSPDARWSDFLANGIHARPTSMISTTSTADHSLSQDANSSLMASPSRLSRSSSVRRKSNRKGVSGVFIRDDTVGSSTLVSSSTSDDIPKSQTIKGLLPSLQNSDEYSSSSTSSPLARKGPPPLQNLRLAFPPAQLAVLSPDQRTPRAKNLPGLSSPTWTSSTCGSEEDVVGLMTPSDDDSSCRAATLTSSIRTFTGDTPPLDTLEDNVAERVGFERGLDSLGSSANHQAMRSMTGVNLASRRGSLPGIKAIREEHKVYPNAHFSSSDDTHSSETLPPNMAPNLNRSTLFQIGQINGITPPASREHVNHPSSTLFNSVVSAGLEMGLGVGMTASALSSNLPMTSSSGINSIAEPRFSRHSVPSPNDYSSFAANLKMTDSQLQMDNVPAPSHYTSEAASDRAADEVTFAELDREDAELARRRTTGGIAAAKREANSIGKRRHVRYGTHDSQNTGKTMSIGHRRLASSISSFPGLAEENSYNGQDEQLTHGLTRLDISSRGPPGLASGSSSIISDAIASGGLGSTPLGTPLQARKAMLSPDIVSKYEGNSYMSSMGDESGGDKRDALNHYKDESLAKAAAHPVAGPVNGGLMGMGGGGHFGPGVRAKITEVLDALIGEVPLMTNQENGTIQLVEYGCLNSRSAQLMQPIISAFAIRHAEQVQSLSHDSALTAGYDNSSESVQQQQQDLLTESASISFQVTHEDSSAADFRPLTQLLDSHPESYLDAHWQNSHSPSLTNAIFPTFSARPFASRISPPQTFHAGISLMDLHWTHTPANSTISPATTAQAELTTFLSARGHEFRRGGVLIMAYIARSEERTLTTSLSPGGSPIPSSKDIWTTLSNTLAPCIQRLVSCSMVKSDVARHLLDLPMHPRSAKQTKTVLKNLERIWKVEWSCGLGDQSEQSSKLPASEPNPLRLPHPAWKAYNSGTLSRVPFTEHMIQLFKNLYESHFRSVLREKGKLSKGAVEFVLDSLWDVLFSRIVDQHPSPMKDVEIEVSIVALRRQ